MNPDDHTYASAVVRSQKIHKRKAADFYPTPPDVTVALLRWLNLTYGTKVWEPACGDGAMSRVLMEYVGESNVLASDLREDSGFGRGGVNFLKCVPWVTTTYSPDWIITNPPFDVAAAFIEKALSFTDNVAMLLKSQYWHAKSRIHLFEKHPPAWVLPLTWRPAFLESERGTSPLMDVSWMVWRKGETETRFEPIRRPSAREMSRLSFDIPELSQLLG